MGLMILKPAKGSIKQRKRVGRGNASQGSQCGRGHKGQKSRSGSSIDPGFEGGQMPLYRRVPKKRGYGNLVTKETFLVVNLDQLNESFSDGDVVSLETIKLKRVVKGKHDKKLKILGSGELTKKLVINAHAISKSALEKIEQSGTIIKILNKHEK